MRHVISLSLVFALMTGASTAAEIEFIGPNGESPEGYSLNATSTCTHRINGTITEGDAERIRKNITELAETYRSGGLQMLLVPRIAPNSGSPLARDLSRDEVKLLQQALAQNGFYTGSIDGVAGGGTQDGLKRFISYRNRDLATMAPLEALAIVLIASRQPLPNALMEELGINASEYEHMGQSLNFLACLNSPGGSLVEGVAMASVFKDLRVPTKIEAGAICESACALAFMGGTQGFIENDVTIRRYLHPQGKLGFHSPALAIPEGQYTQANVERAFQIALDAIATINEQLTSQNDVSEPYVKPSLISALLRTPARDMLYVDTVDLAGQWGIDVGPMVDLPRADDAVLSRSCIQSVEWAQDKSAFETKHSYEYPLFVTQKPDGRMAVVYSEMRGLECLYPTTPGGPLPMDNVALPSHVSGRFSPLSYFPAETQLQDLARK